MNDGTTRREFLGSVAAFSLFPFEQEKPDPILHNGYIVTIGRDPLRENPSTLITIPVERTMANGHWTFES